jgi:Glycosyltransferase family 9 (heptosyltransferase)
MPTRSLLVIDRLFWLPHKLTEFVYFRTGSFDPRSDYVFVIKLMGMGSIIRFASLCEQHKVDKSKITLITFSRQQEVCELFGFSNLFIIRSKNPFLFLGDCLALFRLVRKRGASYFIDFERCSHAVSTFRLMLALWGKCNSLSFEAGRFVDRGKIVIHPADKISLEQLFQIGIEKMAKASIGSASTHLVNTFPKKVLININASDLLLTRRYPIESYAEVVKQLHQTDPNLNFLFTGSAHEFEYVQKLVSKLDGLPVHNQAGKWNLSQLIDELSNCALFISGDSGPVHLGIHLSIPMLALWGPTQPAHFGYRPTKNLIPLSLQLSCSPCFIHPNSKPAIFCKGRIDCLANLSPSLVTQEAIKLLSQSTPQRSINFPTSWDYQNFIKPEDSLAK